MLASTSLANNFSQIWTTISPKPWPYEARGNFSAGRIQNHKKPTEVSSWLDGNWWLVEIFAATELSLFALIFFGFESSVRCCVFFVCCDGGEWIFGCVYTRWLYLDIENYTTAVEFLMNLWMSDFTVPTYHRIIASYLCNKFIGTMKHLHPSQVLGKAKRCAGIKLLPRPG